MPNPSNSPQDALQAAIFNRLRAEYAETHEGAPDHVELDKLAYEKAKEIIESQKKNNIPTDS